ncbi:MAG: DUF560 domain-containing protein [Burkholderiales bacterium]|nr:DUF560 domain-containing protein [Burkholderiales bacterium]
MRTRRDPSLQFLRGVRQADAIPPPYAYRRRNRHRLHDRRACGLRAGARPAHRGEAARVLLLRRRAALEADTYPQPPTAFRAAARDRDRSGRRSCSVAPGDCAGLEPVSSRRLSAASTAPADARCPAPDGSAAHRDAGRDAGVTAQYLHPLNDRWALLAQGAVSMTSYFGHSDFNNDSLAAALALLYRKDGFSASIQPNFRLYRQQDDTDTAAYGVTARATQALDDGWRITGSVGYFDQNVPSNDDRDAKGGLASFGFSKLLSPRVEVGAEYLVQRERANEGIYSRTLHGPVLYAVASVHQKVVLTGSYRYSDIHYDDRQAIFPHTRHDDQHIASIGVDWDIGEWTTKGLRLRGQYTYIDNRSNLDAYRYDRRILSVGLAMRF